MAGIESAGRGEAFQVEAAAHTATWLNESITGRKTQKGARGRFMVLL